MDCCVRTYLRASVLKNTSGVRGMQYLLSLKSGISYFLRSRMKINERLLTHKFLFQNSGKRADFTSSGFLDTSRSQDDSYSSGGAELKSSICYMPYVKTVLKKSLKYNSLDESVKIGFLATFVAFNLLYWFYFLYLDS